MSDHCLLLSDDVLPTADLLPQTYARHLAELLPDQGRPLLIGRMRALLEQGEVPEGLVAAGQGPQHAVDRLGALSGIDVTHRAVAMEAARHDAERSLFLLDPATELLNLIDVLEPARVLVASDHPDFAAAVADAVDLLPFVTGWVPTSYDPADDPATDGSRTVSVSHRWRGIAERTQAAGGRVGLVDRFGPGPGDPTWRAATLPELVQLIEAGR